MDDKYLFGMDCAGRELSKRQHLVFNNPNAIKGTIGFSALLYGEYKPGQLLVDPCSLSGNIAIEAALFESGISINFYAKKFTLLEIEEFREIIEEVMKKIDAKTKGPLSKPDIVSVDSSFNNISAQKKNSKIAGVEKFIAFSRTDVKDLDIKTFDDRIDLICSRVPEPSNHFSESQARTIYATLFKNMKYIVKKKAKLVFIVRNPEILEQEAEKEGYKEEDLKQVWQGQQGYFLVKFIATETKEY
jgi:23S rRNA G2445 N2-methylase RlmL